MLQMHKLAPPAPAGIAAGLRSCEPRPAVFSSAKAVFRCDMPSNGSKQVCVRRAPPLRAALDLDALDMPDIDGDIKSVQRELGAIFDEDGVIKSYKNQGDKAVEAMMYGVALMDRSHWGRLRVGGPGARRFLHAQTTADFDRLAPGQGTDTVFVTAQGRMVDLATAYMMGEQAALLVVSPGAGQSLLQRMDKHAFPADQVSFADISSRTVLLTLVGPDSGNVLKEIGGDVLAPIVDGAYSSHTMLQFAGAAAPVIVAVGCGLAVPGYNLIVDESIAGDVFAVLAAKGCVPAGQQEWERMRTLQGRPALDVEITEAYNPLEAGLYHAVSVNKGCYIGQETLSKLHVQDGVKQQLWGLSFPFGTQAPRPGDDVMDSTAASAERIGTVTSVAMDPERRPFALAYVRCRSGGAQMNLQGVQVAVNGQRAKVVDLDYAVRRFAAHAAPPAASAGDSVAERSAEAKAAKEAAKAAEEAAKAERLAAMQARLAAWQAQQAPPQQQQ